MVKKTLLSFMGLFFLISVSFAAEFTASVDRHQIEVGENLLLKLQLSGASAESKPDVSTLKNAFNIISQQQSSNMVIVNGHISSSSSWHYTLVPKKEGQYTIPALTIKSSAGTIASQPIAISVSKASSPSAPNKKNGITISAKASKLSPYKNESIIYTVKIVSRYDLVNSSLGKINVEGAIVEANGEPQISDSTQNGEPVKVIEATYIITPLKTGKLIIPAIVIQGRMLVQDSNPFDQFYDPFTMLRNFNSLNPLRLENFAITSQAVTLEVKEPVKGIDPWIPATSLKISENWDDTQILKVGEPLTRIFTIVAKGIDSAQLPSLKAEQIEEDDFKVYVNKPNAESEVKNGIITSWREESYTLIPQRSGTLILPEISIAWWNVKENKVNYAKVPARSLKVEPKIEVPSEEKPPQKILPQVNNASQAIIPTVAAKTQENTIFYVIIASLLIVLLFMLFLVIIFQRKIKRLGEKENKTPLLDTSMMKKIRPSAVSHKDLANVKSAAELQHFLQSYAQYHWHTAKNASLDILFASAKKQCPALLQKDIDYIVTSMHDALYADKDINLEDIKSHCMVMLQTTKKKVKKTQDKTEKLPDLNPN
ncbi:MAG: BatD family protein [Alphaproteobacteria bacterium]|nr:BatD family protein [Alphaproteobacteria bacterium]